MKKYIILISLLLVAAFSSCEKTLDIDYDDVEPLLVVQGNVSNYGIRVYVNNSSDMKDTINKAGLPDAEVILSGSDGYEEQLEFGDGLYFSPSNAKGKPGVTYTLHVKHGGRECYAKSTMPEIVDIDSTCFKWMPIIGDVDIFMLNVYLTDKPDREDYYYCELLRDGKRVKRTYTSDSGLSDEYNYFYIGLISRNHWKTEEEEKAKTGKVEDYILYGGDRFTISLRNTTKEAHHFLTTGGDNSDGVNPESNLVGDNCLGYFSVYAESRVDMVYPYLSDFK